MITVRSPRFLRTSWTAALLLALSTVPAVALAQDTGPMAVLGGTGTTSALSLSATTALSHPPMAGTVASVEPPFSAVSNTREPWSRPAPRLLDDAHAVAAQSVSLSRHLLVGSGIGAAAGAAFGLAVVSLADCGGPNCSEERVVGVAGHALAGAVVGALVGGVAYLVRR